MSNRTLWSIVGVSLLVFIALLSFGVIKLTTVQEPAETTNSSAAAAKGFHVVYDNYQPTAPAYVYDMAA